MVFKGELLFRYQYSVCKSVQKPLSGKLLSLHTIKIRVYFLSICRIFTGIKIVDLREIFELLPGIINRCGKTKWKHL
jgi:hypothetical protein